jgi:hypothetical protein
MQPAGKFRWRMSYKGAIFWFGITVFLTGLLVLVEGDRGLMSLAVTLIILGLAAPGYVVYAFYHPAFPTFPVWVSLLLVTWTFLAYDIYDRHFGATAHAVRTSVRMDRFQFRSPKWPIALEPGKPTEMNIGIANFGPLAATNVGWASKLFWTTTLSKPAEDAAWSDFVKHVPEKDEIDMDPTNESWATFASGPLQASDLSGISQGKARLYMFLRFHYRDGGGLHTREICESLQTPLQPERDARPVWHTCLGHMKVQ